jgi:hypothetical protein
MTPSQRFDREEVEKKLKNIKASGTPGPDKAWSRYSITWQTSYQGH